LALNKKIPFKEEELNRDLSQPLAGKDPSTVTIPTPGIILCLLLYLFVIALFVVVLFVAVLCVILHPPVVAAYCILLLWQLPQQEDAILHNLSFQIETQGRGVRLTQLTIRASCSILTMAQQHVNLSNCIKPPGTFDFFACCSLWSMRYTGWPF
jgi:hypothetical protein